MARPQRYFQPQLFQQLTVKPTQAAAYFRLSIGYKGPIFRIRRASDNAEQDFFSPNPGPIATFCGASNGFVRTVYDQSGNGLDWGEAVVASQPKLYDSATGINKLVATGSCLAASYDGVIQQLERASSATLTGNPAWTISDLFNCTDNTLSQFVWYYGKHTAGDDGYIAHQLAGTISTTTQRLNGATALSVAINVVFTGAIAGAQYVTTSHPNGGLDTLTSMRRNGVALTQTSSTGLTIAINSNPPSEAKWGAGRSLAGPSAVFFKGNAANLIMWNGTELLAGTANLANLESWQNARMVS